MKVRFFELSSENGNTSSENRTIFLPVLKGISAYPSLLSKKLEFTSKIGECVKKYKFCL